MNKALRRVTIRVRSWIRTNITGDSSNGYVRDPGAAKPNFDEQLESAMEVAEVMSPPPFTDNELLNPKAVKFWVKKLVDWVGELVVSGIVAVFAWIYFRSTNGGKVIAESDGHHDEQIKVLLPAAAWVVCFIILAARRLLARSRRAKANR